LGDYQKIVGGDIDLLEVKLRRFKAGFEPAEPLPQSIINSSWTSLTGDPGAAIRVPRSTTRKVRANEEGEVRNYSESCVFFQLSIFPDQREKGCSFAVPPVHGSCRPRLGATRLTAFIEQASVLR